jgi:2,3-bisphosphoglycerate-dependent phosphoglycerate mutase
VRPPPISSFSHHYPGNDDRYVNYVQDIGISVFETMIRSLAHRKFELHRQFPKTESLKDCMERTIPYFKNTILPQSIDKGKSVLISSSEYVTVRNYNQFHLISHDLSPHQPILSSYLT